MGPRRIPRHSPWWALLAIAATAFAYQLPYFDRAMFLMDEGHILQFADIVSRGGELYRDATLLPLPGAFYLLAGVFDVFGPSIRTARWVAVVEFSLLCVFAYLILQRLVSQRAAWVGLFGIFLYRIWAFPHWHMYSYSTLAQCLLAGSLVALLRFLANADRRALSVAGFATGLAVLCKQDYGVAGLVAWNAVLLVRHFSADAASPERGARAFVAYNLPAVAIGAVTALHFLRQGLFGEMLQQTLLNHLIGIATFEYSSLPPLWPLLAQEPLFRVPLGYAVYVPSIVFQVDWDLLRASAFYNETYGWDLAIKAYFFAPYLILAAAVGRSIWTRARVRDPARRSAWLSELALVAFGTCSVLALNKPVDYVHVAVFYWSLLLLVVWLLDVAVAGRPRLGRTLAAILVIPAIVFAAYTGRLATRLTTLYDTPLRGERAGVFVLPDEERVIGEVVDWVRDHSGAGERFPVLPYFPLVSFLADRDGPHRTTYTFWPIEYIPDRQQQIIAAIDALPNDRLVYHFTQFVVFPRMSEFAPELFAYLVDRYETERVFTSADWGYMVAGARRSTAPPRGVPILDPGDPAVALRVERDAAADLHIRPEQHGRLFETALWPFRRVLALRPLTGDRRSVATVEVDVPPDAVLETAISVHPALWFQHPPSSVTFELRVVDGDRRETLHTQTIRPHQDARDRRWFDWEVPLSRFAGRRIALEFTTACERTSGEELRMGGWELPRLVVPDP